MHNPIKRVWVPKKPESGPAVAPTGAPAAPKAAATRNMLFDEMPEPDVEEKNSDSIWAEFDSVFQVDAPNK